MMIYIKKLLLRKKISFFRMSIFSLCVIPAMIFFPLYILILVYWGIESLGLYFILFDIVLSVFIFIVWMMCYLVRIPTLRKFVYDYRQNNFVEEECYLDYAEPMLKKGFFNVSDKILGKKYFLNKESFFRCTVHLRSNRYKNNHFFFVQTMETMDFLHRLIGFSEKNSNVIYKFPPVDFDKTIPIKIIYGEKSKILKEIQPVGDYVYTSEQIKSFYGFNEELKKSEKEKKYFRLYYSIFVLFVESLIYGILISSILMYLLLWFANGLDIWNSFVDLLFAPFLIFAVVSLVGLIYGIMSDSNEYTYVLKSWKKNDLVTEIVYFLSSDSFRTINYFSICAGYFFPNEKPSLQKLCVIKQESFKTKQSIEFKLNWICTESKKKVLKNVYQLKDVSFYSPLSRESLIATEFVGEENPLQPWTLRIQESAVRSGINFSHGVPLLISYVKHSYELKSIAPVEGYEYTEAQLSAIEKFNTLYP